MLAATQSFMLKFLVLIHLITTRASFDTAFEQAVFLGIVLFGCGLTRLDFDLLTSITNSFALVGLRFLSDRTSAATDQPWLLNHSPAQRCASGLGK